MRIASRSLSRLSLTRERPALRRVRVPARREARSYFAGRFVHHVGFGGGLPGRRYQPYLTADPFPTREGAPSTDCPFPFRRGLRG